MQKFGLLKGAGLTLVVLAAALYAAELTIWMMTRNEYRIHKPYSEFVLHPVEQGLQGASDPARVTFNALGIRGGEIPEGDALRILALGGSTTIQYFLDDERTWPARLRSNLIATGDWPVIWVGNAGRPGLGGAESYLQLEHLYSHIQDIDVVLMLIGAIDAERALVAPKKTVMSQDAMLRRAFSVQPRGPFLSPLDPESHVGRKFSRLYWKINGVEMVWPTADNPIVMPQGDHNNGRKASKTIDIIPDLYEPLLYYKKRLHALADLAEENHTMLIFITQPTMYRENMPASEELKVTAGRIQSQGNPDGTAPYYSVRAQNETLNRFHAVLIAVCEERNLRCIDLNSLLPKDQTNYIDYIHFSEKGAQQAAAIIAAELIDDQPLSGD